MYKEFTEEEILIRERKHGRMSKELYEKLTRRSEKFHRLSNWKELMPLRRELFEKRHIRWERGQGRDWLETKALRRGRLLEKFRELKKILHPSFWDAGSLKDKIALAEYEMTIGQYQIKVLRKLLAKKGFRKAKNSSYYGRRVCSYYISDGKRNIRLSNHELPDTMERRYYHSNFGTWWDEEIIPQRSDSIEEVLEGI